MLLHRLKMRSLLALVITLLACFYFSNALSDDGNYDIKVKVVKPKKTFKSMISAFSSVRTEATLVTFKPLH